MIKILFLIESVVIAVLSAVLNPINSFWQALIPLLIFVLSYAALSILYFVYLYILGLFVNKKKTYLTQNPLYNATTVYTMQWLLNMGHVKLKVTGKELIPHDQKYLFVYNHTSNFDPIVQSWVLRKDNLVHISKPSNLKIPIAGPVVYRNCYIPIDRENDREAIKSIVRAIGYIKENKFCVGVSPEGTRNKGDVKTLLPFKNGCFKIATKTGCPIVIAEMKGLNKISKNFPFKSTKIEMNILSVLYYEDYKNMTTFEIGETVRSILQNKLDGRREDNELLVG